MKRIIQLPLASSFSVFAMVALLASCGPPQAESTSASQPPESEAARVTALGEEASQSLMQSLGARLKAAMESGGAVEAIQVCQQVALPLTATAGEPFEGVTIRRTSLKTRNPANTPDGTDRRVLKEMAEQSAPSPRIEWEGGVARYYAPLLMQELCLTCHGNPETFPPALAETLATLYPQDAATGYEAGELRGVIRVDVQSP